MADANKSYIWPDHYRVVSERLHQFFTTGQLVDVAVIAGHNQVFAHRAVLAAASPVFLSQLQLPSGPPFQIHLDTLVEDCTSHEVHDIIEFIYCGKVCVPQHRLSVFLNVAHHLQLVGFHEAPAHPQCNNISMSSQRSGASGRPSLHIPLPEPSTLPATPAIAANEIQNFLPQLTIPIPTAFQVGDSQPSSHSLPQLVDSEINIQDESFLGNSIMQDTSVPSAPALYSKYHHHHHHEQEFVEKSMKYGEQFKVDNSNIRHFTGSLSNATFGDLCTGESDLNLLFLNDSRPLNSSLRQHFSESCNNDSAYESANNYPRDYSQANLKLVSHGLFEHDNTSSIISDEHQPLSSTGNSNSMDWTALANGNMAQPPPHLPVTSTESFHSSSGQTYASQNSDSSSSLAMSSSVSSSYNVVTQCSSLSHEIHHDVEAQQELPIAPLELQHPSHLHEQLPHQHTHPAATVTGLQTHSNNAGVNNGITNTDGLCSSQLNTPCTNNSLGHYHNNTNNSSINNTANFWSVGEGSASHKWCMPDETSLPKHIDCQHPSIDSEHSNWAGGGRLKVKASIGGVSVQDLSTAVGQANDESLPEEVETLADDAEDNAVFVSSDASCGADVSPDDGCDHSSLSIMKTNINQSNVTDSSGRPSTSTKLSSGKLAVRTDIGGEVSCSIDVGSSSTGGKRIITSSDAGKHGGGGKTASISVVRSEELLDTRHLREESSACSNNSSIAPFSKLSIVPAQQLLESNISAVPPLTLQDMVYRDESIQHMSTADDVVKIKLVKPCGADSVTAFREGSLLNDVRRSTSCLKENALNNFLGATDLCTRQIELRDSVDVNENEALDNSSSTQIGEEEETDVEVVQTEDNNTSIDNDNLDSVIEQPSLISERSEVMYGENVFQMDSEEDLQVILTSSHQHHLYHPHYSFSPHMDFSYLMNEQQSGDDVTPVKDTAKAQWESLRQKQKHNNQSYQAPEAKEIKVKSGVQQSPTHSTDTCLEVLNSPAASLGSVDEPRMMTESPVVLQDSPSEEANASSSRATPSSIIELDESTYPPSVGSHSLLVSSIPIKKKAVRLCDTRSASLDDHGKDIDDVSSIRQTTSSLPAPTYGAKECDVPTSFSNILSSRLDHTSKSGVNDGHLLVDSLDVSYERTYGANSHTGANSCHPISSQSSKGFPSKSCDANESSKVNSAKSSENNELITKVYLSKSYEESRKINSGKSCGVSELGKVNSGKSCDVSESEDVTEHIEHNNSEELSEEPRDCEVVNTIELFNDKSVETANDIEAIENIETINNNIERKKSPLILHVKKKIKECDLSDVFKIMCNKCNEVLTSEKMLLQHSRSHYSEASPLCCLCSKVFKSKSTLRVHILKHILDHEAADSKMAHKCSECDAAYTQRSNLVRHMASRHQLTQEGNLITDALKCSQCSYSCFSKHKLSLHLRSHIVDKPHKCPHCNYQSSEKYAINRHLRTHTKEKPYVCDVCNFNANTPSILARHKRTHTQEKPHICDKCGQQYADHKRLRDHLFKHDNVKPFVCHICPYSCRRKDNLQSHILKMHSGNSKKKNTSKSFRGKRGRPQSDENDESSLKKNKQRSTSSESQLYPNLKECSLPPRSDVGQDFLSTVALPCQNSSLVNMRVTSEEGNNNVELMSLNQRDEVAIEERFHDSAALTQHNDQQASDGEYQLSTEVQDEFNHDPAHDIMQFNYMLTQQTHQPSDTIEHINERHSQTPVIMQL